MKKFAFKVLFDANPLMAKRTGVGTSISRLMENFALEHPEVRVVGYYYNFLGRKKPVTSPVLPNLTYRPIYWMPGPLVNLLRRWHVLLPVELLTLTRADFLFYPNYLGLSSLFGTPSACTVHDLTFVDLPDYVARKNLHDLQNYLPAQMHRSRFLVTVSGFTKRRMCEEFHLNPADILVTPNPPEPPMAISKRVAQSTLKDLGVARKYILTLGTVEPRKNLPNMLEAYLQLPQQLQDKYTFVIAGKVGWNCEREVALLDQLKKEGKNILHIGYVTDEQRAVLYENATMFSSASWYEGFGMPALEAMIAKTPCAMSNIDVFHEVAGDTVLYFDESDPRSIAKSWQQILDNSALQRRLADAGYARARSYKWSTVANSLYDRIVLTLQGKQN